MSKVINRVAPNPHAQQRIKDKVPPCNHESVAEQVAFAWRPLPKELQQKCMAICYCSVCLQRVRITLDVGSQPVVGELVE